jgi:hypothetical protein
MPLVGKKTTASSQFEQRYTLDGTAGNAEEVPPIRL